MYFHGVLCLLLYVVYVQFLFSLCCLLFASYAQKMGGVCVLQINSYVFLSVARYVLTHRIRDWGSGCCALPYECYRYWCVPWKHETAKTEGSFDRCMLLYAVFWKRRLHVHLLCVTFGCSYRRAREHMRKRTTTIPKCEWAWFNTFYGFMCQYIAYESNALYSKYKMTNEKQKNMRAFI